MEMLKVSQDKYAKLENLSDENGIISALAIDQRGSLKKMIHSEKDSILEEFKVLISENLTTYASSILLDPEYGLPASKARDKNSGLILAYEKTGYDASSEERFPDLLDNWSVLRIKEKGADAVKILLYYDIDADPEINDVKHVFIERVGSECEAEEIPFFLEILTYDANNEDNKGKEYAKVKPHKVNEAMKLFSQDRFKVDVLKVEVPVNMNYVEGFCNNDYIYTQEEALEYFKSQSQATHLPFIFLSAGVSAELFQDTIEFAGKAGSTFNGVLCGRATWKEATDIFADDFDNHRKTKEWLNETGKENIEKLNKVVNENATSWKEKVIMK
ncbi:tagatose-bisphosphate aldolase [Suicoccus acidiformans]|uniref:Tagatose 1,6-diphosphate aldolase n=1 Tax=Suicoccus acidiformans TaxID=2036206 RepID=A0A347WIS4_9LACT|nr:tagatose-bisphosphate aldolase [Suicoccus acidiformans]AXY24981.1 tagatose-bisphosphate aldolase [Suicoccus acidiformans]